MFAPLHYATKTHTWNFQNNTTSMRTNIIALHAINTSIATLLSSTFTSVTKKKNIKIHNPIYNHKIPILPKVSI